MSISILQRPFFVGFSQDPMIYEFQTDNQIISTGVAPVSVLVFTGEVPEEEVVVLKWGSTELRMIAKAEPVLSNEFPADTTDLAILLPYFRDNYTIDKDFTVTIDSGALKFTAKTAGSTFDLSEVTFEGGSVSVMIAGVNPVVRKNFNFWYELYIEKATEVDTFIKVSEDTIPVDSGMRAKLDISQLLHSHLEPDMPYDFMSGHGNCRKSKRKYYIRFAEVFGEKPQVQKILKDEPRHVLLGGTSKTNRQYVVDLVQGVDTAADACLRYGDVTRFVGKDEEQYLYFLCTRGATTVRVAANISYYDETNETKYSWIEACSLYDKVYFDVSLAKFEPDAEKTVTQYSLQVVDAVADDNPLSKTYTYVLDYAYRKTVRRFIYLNSLGAVDVVSTYGKGTKEVELTKLTAEKADDDITLVQFQDFDVQGRESYSVATGFRSKRELAYMRDFFLSESKYLKKSGKWVPILVDNKSIQEASDVGNLQGYKFEFTLAFEDDSLDADDVGEIIGVPLPPQGFLGGGSITINIGSPGTIVIDGVPTLGSSNAVSSGGVYNALLTKQAKLAIGVLTQYFRGDLTLGTLAEDVYEVLKVVLLANQQLTGVQDEVNTVFTTEFKFKEGSTRVYVNGVRQMPGEDCDYVEVDEQTIEFTIAPEADSVLLIDYQKLLDAYGNIED